MSGAGPSSLWSRIAGRLRARGGGRPFDALQIEITTRCSLRCVMCPRTAMAGQWPELDLPWETFLRAARAFGRVRHVHLQGWGEPLLHPRLFDMVAAAKTAGCEVGLTSNGMGLDPGAARRLLDLGLDLLAVSIGGARPETHARIRVGSHLSTILENVRRLIALRSATGPKVELAYLMTRMNVPELPAAVEMAADLGVDELYATNLDYVLTPEQERLKAFGKPGGTAAAARHVEAAQEVARRRGIRFRAYPLQPQEVSVCEANPLKMLFIASDGWVSPCTYMGLAGRTTVPRRFDGQPVLVPRVRFGDVAAEELATIWESPEYIAFRRRFASRQLGPAFAMFASRGADPVGRPEPPDACRSCYKLYGL